MTFLEWYDTLAKPSWTPEPAFIGLMWQIIYRMTIGAQPKLGTRPGLLLARGALAVRRATGPAADR